MITPPLNVKSYYTALFEKPAAAELMKFVAPAFSGDVKQVLVTSTDMTSDIEAIIECQAVTNRIAALVGEADASITYNPIYLPHKKDLSDQVEVDSDGDITTIAGFGNPLISAHLKHATEENPTLIDAKVCYKPFEFPELREVVKNTSKHLLS
jgi:hypothetical protein